MKYGKLFYTLVAIVFTVALVAGYSSAAHTAGAQISPRPTETFTPIGGPPTDTPAPPTDTPAPPTDTPAPPTDTPAPPTNTPPPPTNTPTPILLPPQMGAISIVPPDGVVEVGTPVDVAASFTIPSTTDLGTVTWDWGDGTTSTCPADPACTVDPGVGRVTGSYTYNEPGVYTVQLMVFDVFGQFDTSIYEFVVVYDPNSGYVTGRGWIDSRAGAYKPDPSLTGKARFGFASRYKKGAIRPTGYTRFQFHVADMNFKSDGYQWLVVNRDGSRAQFKGDGTINGAPSPIGDNYQFKLWAKDGDASGAADTFRIRIWYEDDDLETIVYDNGFDQPIGSGSIAVHTGKRK